MSEIFLLLILGHLVADYIFQTSSIYEMKSSGIKAKRKKGLWIHISIHFIIYLIFILPFAFLFNEYVVWKWLIALLVIALLHYLVDKAKLFFDDKMLNFSNKYISKTSVKLLVYILDQLIHLIIIYMMLRFIGVIDYNLIDFWEFFLALMFSNDITFSNTDKILAIISLLILSTHFFAYFLEILLKPIKPTNKHTDKRVEEKFIYNENNEKSFSSIEEFNTTFTHQDSDKQAGKYIGMAERLIIVILVLSQSITGIAFLIAIKAATRFKQFEDKRFSEFYLIGSLLSVLWGVCIGYLISLVLK